ncbi:MAG: MATE family efflux transporter [Alphaproteobacteria bacterium]|nr:MATE family efflux transporter [Alphaproteobacteria bacterium]
MSSPVVNETRATLALALPLAAANLSQMAMSVIDTVMVGKLGAVPLAAVALGSGFYFTGVVICIGVLTAVAPLAAYAIGAGDRPAAGRVARSGLVLAALLSLLVIAATALAGRLLDLIGYDPALAREIGRFLRAVCWGAPGFLGFVVLRSLLAALERTRGVMVVLVLCVPANAALNWVLIFGHLGVPALGLAGAGIASASVQWLMLAGLAAAVWRLRRAGVVPRANGGWRGVPGDLRRILRLGAPIGGLQALEVGVFVTSAAVVGLFGADPLAAHQIAINYASITFMVPMGIGQAATVRVAAERGAQRQPAARRAAWVALALGTSFMAASAVAIWTLPQAIVGLYVAADDPANRELVTLALRFLVFAGLFQVVDGIQVVAAGALRGYEDTVAPMVFAGIGYWGIGFAGGWALTFPLRFGPVGMWWGFVLGLSVVAALLTLRLYRQSTGELIPTDAIPESGNR